jgi:hypothetical protein
VPRGGPRPNSGRPTRAVAEEKARLLTETIEKGARIDPRAFLHAVLASPGSTRSEKMRAAEMLLKLPPEPPPSGANIPPSALQIWALPRNCQISECGKKVVWPNGDETDPEPPEMFEPTPLPSTPRRRETEPAQEEALPFETQEQELPQNVRPLHPRERVYGEGRRFDPSLRKSAADPFRFKPD